MPLKPSSVIKWITTAEEIVLADLHLCSVFGPTPSEPLAEVLKGKAEKEWDSL